MKWNEYALSYDTNGTIPSDGVHNYVWDARITSKSDLEHVREDLKSWMFKLRMPGIEKSLARTKAFTLGKNA